MAAKDVLEKLDWEYHPSCQVLGALGHCLNAASATAIIHANNLGTACGDTFAYVCTGCLKRLMMQLQSSNCVVPGCDRVGVAGFLRSVNPLPVVTP